MAKPAVVIRRSLIDLWRRRGSCLGGAPSHWACYRFAAKLRADNAPLAACLDKLVASLREYLPEIGVDVAIDASDMPAYANGQRYVYNGGPERERFSDPDASWGHRSAVSTRKGGGFYGYRIHAAVCSTTGLPLAWRVETARSHESMHVASLLDAVRARGFKPETCAMDMGYDNNRVYAECAERDCGDHPATARPERAGHPRPAQERRLEAALPPPLRRRARVRTLEARIRVCVPPRSWVAPRSASR